MKIVSDFRVRFENGMVIYLLPMVLYYLIFRNHIYNLFTGGIMFVYLTMIIAFVFRYIREGIAYRLADSMGRSPQIKLKTLHPRSVPSGFLSKKEVRYLEIMPAVYILLLSGLASLMAYLLTKDSYVTKVCVGTMLLNTMIFWKNFKYVMKTFEYSHHVFEYNERTVKIYDQEGKGTNTL